MAEQQPPLSCSTPSAPLARHWDAERKSTVGSCQRLHPWQCGVFGECPLPPQPGGHTVEVACPLLSSKLMWNSRPSRGSLPEAISVATVAGASQAATVLGGMAQVLAGK
eukprot:CAMPEP_0171080312 /NCGR_PEP_ID=MMETSP0766_2-20121228/15785_1 /TAXON_ID=439317 /ORGANISM="Gambierdiscus australes, Strain CAWD 149" /LENGTH=108 /DNA_ID=CAMNT_0011537539 /DNA_START=1679 /DNA_END=2005 /DNA_ORIENTATION=-